MKVGPKTPSSPLGSKVLGVPPGFKLLSFGLTFGRAVSAKGGEAQVPESAAPPKKDASKDDTLAADAALWLFARALAPAPVPSPPPDRNMTKDAKVPVSKEAKGPSLLQPLGAPPDSKPGSSGGERFGVGQEQPGGRAQVQGLPFASGVPHPVPAAGGTSWGRALEAVRLPRDAGGVEWKGVSEGGGGMAGVEVGRVAPRAGGGVLEFELRTERGQAVQMQLEVQGERAKLVCRCEGVHGVGQLQDVLHEIKTIMERVGFEGEQMEVEFTSSDPERDLKGGGGGQAGREKAVKDSLPWADDPSETDVSSHSSSGTVRITGVLWAIA